MLFANATIAAGTTVWNGYWLEVVVFAASAGALGGLIGVFRDFDIPALMRGDKSYVRSRGRLLAGVAVGALSGVGGSIAVLSILVLDQKFKTPPTDEVRLSLCSLGTVAGFIGFTLLNSLAQELAKRVARQDERVQVIERNLEKIEDQGTTAAISMGFATANQAAQGNVTPEGITKAIADVKQAFDRNPTVRNVGLILGRLYRWSNDLRRAIDVLTQVINARRAAGIADNEDTAAILYNRACYHALISDRANGEDHKAQAFADLRQSVLLDPKNEAEAKQDADFNKIKRDPRFKECFRRNGVARADSPKPTAPRKGARRPTTRRRRGQA